MFSLEASQLVTRSTCHTDFSVTSWPLCFQGRVTSWPFCFRGCVTSWLSVQFARTSVSIDLRTKISLLTISITLAEHCAASVSHRGTRWLAARRVCLTLRSLLIRRSQILNRRDVVIRVDFRWRLINAGSLSNVNWTCSHFPAVAAGGTKTFWACCCQVLWSVTSQVSTQRYWSRLRQLWRHALCLLNSTGARRL